MRPSGLDASPVPPCSPSESIQCLFPFHITSMRNVERLGFRQSVEVGLEVELGIHRVLIHCLIISNMVLRIWGTRGPWEGSLVLESLHVHGFFWDDFGAGFFDSENLARACSINCFLCSYSFFAWAACCVDVMVLWCEKP